MPTKPLSPSIPVEDMAAWLRERYPGVPPGEIEQRLCFNDGAVRRWFRSADGVATKKDNVKKVHLKVLDAAFTAAERPDLLQELFPG